MFSKIAVLKVTNSNIEGNFTKSELLHIYLSSILTADFRSLIFYSTPWWWILLDGTIDCHDHFQHVTNHCHWSCHCHNHNGICYCCFHDDQLLFPEVHYHINYTWNIIFIFGQMILTVLGDISPSNHFILNKLFFNRLFLNASSFCRPSRSF